jgi:hypothetical protein
MRDGEQHPHMTKRFLAAMLWFYTGWYAGAILADLFSVSPLLGPILGVAAAGVIVGDPRRIIWKARASTEAVATSDFAEAT